MTDPSSSAVSQPASQPTQTVSEWFNQSVIRSSALTHSLTLALTKYGIPSIYNIPSSTPTYSLILLTHPSSQLPTHSFALDLLHLEKLQISLSETINKTYILKSRYIHKQVSTIPHLTDFLSFEPLQVHRTTASTTTSLEEYRHHHHHYQVHSGRHYTSCLIGCMISNCFILQTQHNGPIKV